MSMTVGIEAGEARFQANGSRILFPGYLRVYVEGKDDPEAALEDREVLLPPLSQGQDSAWIPSRARATRPSPPPGTPKRA